MQEVSEIKYMETKIKSLLSSIRKEHFQHYMNSQTSNYEEEYHGFTEYWLRERIRDLYVMIQAYLERKEMKLLLETFKYRFEEVVNNDDKILHEESFHPEEPAEELTVINDFKRFLEVFHSFDHNYDNVIETNRLLKILEETGLILEKMGIYPTKEAEVYNSIKWVIDLYYPSTRKKNKARFIGKFKKYNPDILVPEIKTAIEYKFIKSKSNIDEYLDQIKIDATNYRNDNDYENFIAVLYFMGSVSATKESIETAWKAKRFPKNWKLVIANGATVKSIKSVNSISKKINPKDNQSNQKNANKGTGGTNRQYDQAQGNKGKQNNPNQKKK